MPILPTSRTVPQTKDIAVVSALPLRVGTSARQDLDSVMVAVDTAIDNEAIARASGDTTNANNLTAHLNDTVDAHDASAVSFVPAGTVASTDVQAAIQEIDTEYNAADSAEASARGAADTALGTRIDNEIAQLRMTATGSSKVVTIGSSIATRSPDNTQLRLPNGSLVSDFTGATINFATGATTGQVGSFSLINFTGQASKFAKYSLVLLPSQPDSILVIPGTSFYASLAAAQADTSDPAVSGGLPVGIVIVQDDGSAGTGTIVNISQTDLQQMKASGSGSGGAGSGSPLDPDQESNYLFYARSDFAVDGKLFATVANGASFSGSIVDQITGLNRIRFTGTSGIFRSSNLIGSQARSEALVINRATAKLRYDVNYAEIPDVRMSRDGGTTWVTATETRPAANGELVLADVIWSGTDTLDAGAANGTVDSGERIALIVQPAYDQILQSFDAWVGSPSGSGTAVGKIRTVTAGLPQATELAVSAETKTLGQDIVTGRAYVRFTLATPITMVAGTQYAVCVEGSSGTTITTERITTPASWAVSGALHNGSSWSANAYRYPVKLYGAGMDLRIEIDSTISSGESRLLGFGVDFILSGPFPVAGQSSWEERIMTSTESSTGLVTLAQTRYTPGAHQLRVHYNGHVYMAPDFVELSASQIQFSAGFFNAGDTLRFEVGYGLVDGSSQSLGRLNLIYDAIVGSSSQVASGFATHQTIASALAAVPTGGKILVLRGTVTENVTINQEVSIEGQGRGSVISGTLTFGSLADYSTCDRFKVTGNVTFNSGADGIFFRRIFMPSSATLTDNGLANSKLVIVE